MGTILTIKNALVNSPLKIIIKIKSISEIIKNIILSINKMLL